MTWSLEKVCDIHDHGDSLGVVKVLKGEVINTIYTVDKDMNILNSEKIELAEEDVIIEVPEYMYHQMKNGQENEHSYTLHVYMPPINDMKVIDQEKQLIITVENNCGAWTTQPELHKEVEEFKFKKDVAKN
jgi:predicted metal-dependent enzyme (double-stranded beta helix superfamily)